MLTLRLAAPIRQDALGADFTQSPAGHQDGAHKAHSSLVKAVKRYRQCMWALSAWCPRVPWILLWPKGPDHPLGISTRGSEGPNVLMLRGPSPPHPHSRSLLAASLHCTPFVSLPSLSLSASPAWI